MAIDDDITFLERVPTLSLLGRQALRILAIGAETRYIHSGEVLFKRGEEADGAYVIQDGRFKLSSNDGDELTVGPCTLLGEVSLNSATSPSSVHGPTVSSLPSLDESLKRPSWIT